MEEIEIEHEPKLSPQDLDDLWEIERLVDSINRYTETIKRIDEKCPNILSSTMIITIS